jgi:hypothetical protein
VLEERSKNEIGYWAHLLSRGLELSYVSHSLCDFSEKLGYCGPPFRWDEERRFLIRCELDAMLFHLYLGTEREWKELDVIELMEYFPTPRHAVEHIMDTFPIVRRKDEHAHGHYRTKDTILEIYDEMAEVIEANAAAVAAGRESTARYQTRLDPPPGPPTDEAGNFIPMAQWDETIWQRYKDVIHPPREEPVTVAAEAGLQSMAELAYPSTDTDRSICAGALAIVEQISELPSMDHLDALLLATHPDWCELFLSAPDARKLNAAVNKAPSTMFVDEDTSIRWRDARDYLEQRNALAVDHARTGQPITPGSDLAAVKASLPSGVDGLVALALSALNRVKELQEDVAAVSQEQEQVLKSLNREAEAAGFAA